ncbi:TMV resistance protein N-like isoform X2 [Populus alba x Populus x berolinensis]|uniref:TMV resistance protein N-like isoform X2 n=1 Tax=Populus alba x Populus x berolinensis TaxID=444605 RepID=A0AAD6L6Q9_9ROSI|nr:TMV resistance protein N-like isoform X2 [Populus alba x Populus x berolinensis]
MASSSNSTNCWKYSVFLSFRGQETRNTFTAHLYHALCNKGINAFIDDKLERGEHITSQLNQIIEDSRISLVIFSQNYARSIYCLDELVKILECKESKGQVVLPVFYNVDPSDVEEQKGSFGESLDFHETYLGINAEKLKQWREALTKAAQLSGWHLDRGDHMKLKALCLTCLKQKRNLSRIPSSIYKLQHLKRLLLDGCSELTKFPENMPEETQPFCSNISMIANNDLMWFPMLTCLDLQNCKLSEVDFLMNLVCFSTLKDLDLSGNNFVNLPTCINRFTKLRRLELANCIWLEGIPELPRSIKRIGARNCTSLESYSELVRVFMFNTEDRSTKLRDLDFSNCHKLADQNPLQSLADTSSRCISVDEGTDEIEAIMLDFHEPEEMHLNAKAFKKMKRLRILIIRNALLTVAPVYLSNELRWLEWPGCPLLSLPSTFHARKLVVLNMQHSFISHFEGFKCLLLEGCSKLDKFPVNGENEVPSNFLTSSNCYENSSGSDFLPAQANSLEGSSSLGFPALRWLDLRNCCLRNVNFLKMHDCFPMLKELDLSGNSFAIFPETLSLFTHLKSLRLHKCKKLQEIPELPRNIKRLEARDCELLERYSPLEKGGEWPAKLRVVDFSNCHELAKNQGKNLEDAFFSKAFHKQFQVEMFLPGSKIPEWFTFTSEQGSLTYLVPSSVLEKIQGLVICSILCLEDGVTANISCEMFVDGKSMILCSRHFFPLETDHMWLYYQPYCYTRALGKARNDLVRFEISFEVLGAPRGSALKMCGIYFIYKQDKTVSDPSSTQSTSYHTDHSVSFDLMTSSYVDDPDFALSPSMNRKRPASSDLTETCYNDDLELSLNPKVSRRKTDDDQCGEQFSFSLQPMDQKPGNHLIASKSGEHQLEHWLSLSLQPMDVSNWNPMCIKKLEEKVQLQPKSKQEMNFFNELGRSPIREHDAVEYETEKEETYISDVESLA